MIILGIDPGLASTGWAVVENLLEPKLIAYGLIKTIKNLSQEKRFLQIYEELHELIENYRPQVLCLEKVFFNTNAKTALIVGEARGIVKICALLKRVALAEFTPLQIKSAITGYGRAEKKQIQEMVRILLRLDQIPKPDDAADAVAAALTYCFYKKDLEK
ncbi:MAG TPA: crossover junction endodeoxyribonuclease RuvC [Candidatus Bathyarchaeia archaeon]|nr:crossover junction endodeoxyribonuclease RuvC [Candidatus Bathyarchaeia archaeon]